MLPIDMLLPEDDAHNCFFAKVNVHNCTCVMLMLDHVNARVHVQFGVLNLSTQYIAGQLFLASFLL